jgi:hypothetical protein
MASARQLRITFLFALVMLIAHGFAIAMVAYSAGPYLASETITSSTT